MVTRAASRELHRIESVHNPCRSNISGGTDQGESQNGHSLPLPDCPRWAAIAAHQGVDPAVAPNGDALLAVYREWKMLRALALLSSGSGWTFDARFGGTGPDASASPVITHVVGAIASDGTIMVDSQESSGPPPCPICLARGTLIATPRGDVPIEVLRPGDPVWSLD